PAGTPRRGPEIPDRPPLRARARRRAAPAPLAVARAQRAATRQPRRRAWPRIFVVRCGFPCDPPVGVIHAIEGLYHASIARSVTKAAIGKSRECSRRPLGQNRSLR